MEREVGGGIGMGNTCKPMAVSFQCMTKSTTIKKIIKKITLEGINSRISEAEKWLSELKDKMVETTVEEKNKVKRMKRTENSLTDLWDNIKCTNIRIIGVPEEEAKKKVLKRL